jgi:hypothetical protein
MRYWCPDIQAEVLLDKPCIGIEGPEASGAQGEVANIPMVEVPVVFDFVDRSLSYAVFHEKRSVELFAINWPVLIIVA